MFGIKWIELSWVPYSRRKLTDFDFVQFESKRMGFNMSSRKSAAPVSIWSIVLTCATATLYATLFQCNGIPAISAHCTNSANIHASFHRNFSQTYTLNAEQTVTAFLRTGQNARFTVRFDQTSPLTLAIHVDRVGAIIPQLFYNESVNLSRYFLRNATIYNIPCAPMGQYDMLVSSKTNVQINVNVSQQMPFLARKLGRYARTSRIRYEKRVHKAQVLLKWEKSKLDIHAMQYCLSINGHSNQGSFCDAMDQTLGKLPRKLCSNLKTTLNNFFTPTDKRITNIDSKRGSIVCTGARNKHILGMLIENKNYFVDVFGVHKNVPGLIFKLGSTSFIFNQPRPIELSDDQTAFGRISEFDKRSAFTFKPYTIKNAARVILLIIPLDHPIRMNVTLKKLKKCVEITTATVVKFNFNNLTEGDRLMLKFWSIGECHQKRNFKIVATTKSKFSNYPMLPPDMRVKEVTSLSTCNGSTITWHPSPDPRPITYCIAAIKVPAKSFDDFIASVDTCDVERYQKKLLPNQKYDCITSFRNESSMKTMERFKLKNLQQNHGYLIQVTIKLNKEVISYQMLKLFKSHHCFKLIQNYMKLPNTTLSPKFMHQFIEDNKIPVA